MSILSLLAFLVCSSVMGIALLFASFLVSDLREAWRSPLGKDNGGFTVTGNLVLTFAALAVAWLFGELGRQAWAGIGGLPALYQMSALIVGTVGYSISLAAALAIPLCIRDIYRAEKSPEGRSPDGKTRAHNVSAFMGSVGIALFLPVLTTVLVKICLW